MYVYIWKVQNNRVDDTRFGTHIHFVLSVFSLVATRKSSNMLRACHGNALCIIWWYSANLPFVRGIHPSRLDSPERVSNTELWCFPCCYSKQAVKQTVECMWFETTLRSCDFTVMDFLLSTARTSVLLQRMSHTYDHTICCTVIEIQLFNWYGTED